MTMLIDGKAISAQLKDELKSEVARMSKRGRTVTLAVVLVGNDPASCAFDNDIYLTLSDSQASILWHSEFDKLR